MRLNSNATVREMLTSGALSALLDGSLVVLYLALLFAGSRRWALLVVGLALLQVLVFVVRPAAAARADGQEPGGEAAAQSYQVEMLTGMQTLKAIGVEHRAVQHWSNLFVDVLNVSLERGRLRRTDRGRHRHAAHGRAAGCCWPSAPCRCWTGS